MSKSREGTIIIGDAVFDSTFGHVPVLNVPFDSSSYYTGRDVARFLISGLVLESHG